MAKRGRPPMREERVCPTPETAIKLRRDPVQEAAAAFRESDGKRGLAPEQEQALFGIRRAYALITAPVRVRVQLYERRDRAHSELSKAAWALIDRYCDWGDAVHARGLSVMRALDLILDDGERENLPLDEVAEFLSLWPERR